MATILLSAAGAALGGAFGGSVLGLSGAVLGRAIGSVIGRTIDQRLMGQGSEVIETGRLQRYRVTGASEGTAIGQVYGRMRVGGQVIWTTKFKETSNTSGGGGGKGGGGSSPKVKTYYYSVSVAVAVCEGEITHVGRIWADGTELELGDINYRVYSGVEDQIPDPLIEAIEGSGRAPAYRGVAYVVFEDLQLGAFGNRVPQFSFEVMRATDQDLVPRDAQSISGLVQAVALMPGSGEYVLAQTPVRIDGDLGQTRTINANSPSGQSDLLTSLDQLVEELPNCGSASLIVSWFGADLRAGMCEIAPKVEQTLEDGTMPWVVSGVPRSAATAVAQQNGRPIYGGTPTDQSVMESIQALKDHGQEVVFYPFILMDQLAGNTLENPYTGTVGQPELPWRGRITTALAPGVAGSTDGTSAAEAEVAAFFGQADVGDFSVSGSTVTYTGPAEWSFRRFILHYAHLCVAAGGVDAFCIGSELVGLTQIRGANHSFPTVTALLQLAQDVRSILGAGVKIGYAADWSEYFGYHPEDGNVYFHLDPLWASPDIDFVGIDNYMPLSDWRDTSDHADAHWKAIYNVDYLMANVAGGEGYDWYYLDQSDREAQVRSPIVDGAHGEDWVFRYKDIRSWWSSPHYNRIDGQRSVAPTDWVPQSKPIWFTELGCAAIDKGTNQPNKFVDPKSSESSLPYYSTGARDDLIQAQYLRAMALFWEDAANNPTSAVYGGAMVDMSRAHVWAWDARPYPQFPGLAELWSDGANYIRGHWLNGRTSQETLSAVVAEICTRSGLKAFDVSGLYGLVRGYQIAEVSGARAALQPLMLAYGFDAAERNGVLTFFMRNGVATKNLSRGELAITEDVEGGFEMTRASEAENAGRLRLSYVIADGDFDVGTTESIFPDGDTQSVTETELSLALTRAEARRTAERWHAESRVARDTVKFALPLSQWSLGAGDVIEFQELGGNRSLSYRIDGAEIGGAIACEAVRVEPGVYTMPDTVEEFEGIEGYETAGPVLPLFLDLPLLTGDEVPHAPHLAVTGEPWPGSVALYASDQDADYAYDQSFDSPACIGRTQTDVVRARPGIWDRGNVIRVRALVEGFTSTEEAALLSGANVAAIGDGSSGNWEIFQFRKAELVDGDVYELSQLLRGQLGTDAAMPDVWPAGSYVVLLDARLAQIGLASSKRSLARHYRIGPESKALDDAAFVHVEETFAGIGLRPYSPVHLRAAQTGAELELTWVRRSRLDGDPWDGEVPLGEAYERYEVRVLSGSSAVRVETVDQPAWTYTASDQLSDGVGSSYAVEVAQLSDRFGPGLTARIEIDD